MTITKPIEVEANAEKGAVVLWVQIDGGTRDFAMEPDMARAFAEQVIEACDKLNPEATKDALLTRLGEAVRDIMMFERQLARTPQDVFPERHAQIMGRLQAVRTIKSECDAALDELER